MKIKLISTKTNSDKIANEIAKLLVLKKLSPCVQIIPKVESIYNWKEKIEKSFELLIVIKTIPSNVYDCKELILKYHNYNVPELVITDGEIIFNEYSDWFIKNTH